MPVVKGYTHTPPESRGRGTSRVQVDSGLIVSMVRYALGRSTYVVGWTIRELRHLWPDLLERDRATIVRDITEALRDREAKGRSLGMRIDDDEWREFLRDASGTAEATALGDTPTPMELARAALEQYGRVEATGLGTDYTSDLLMRALTAVLAQGSQHQPHIPTGAGCTVQP